MKNIVKLISLMFGANECALTCNVGQTQCWHLISNRRKKKTTTKSTKVLISFIFALTRFIRLRLQTKQQQKYLIFSFFVRSLQFNFFFYFRRSQQTLYCRLRSVILFPYFSLFCLLFVDLIEPKRANEITSVQFTIATASIVSTVSDCLSVDVICFKVDGNVMVKCWWKNLTKWSGPRH